ncbi:MAG: secretin N-terminal domain-containing protein [Spirulinaceae cyanobacterium]
MNQHQHQLKLWMVAPALLLTALPVQANPLAEAMAEAKNKDKVEISQKSAIRGENDPDSLNLAEKLAEGAIASVAETATQPPQTSFGHGADVEATADNPFHFDTTTLETEGLAQNQTAPTFNTNPQQTNPGRIPANPNSDVLVPNPQITIDGNPVNPNPNSNVVIPNAQVDINGMPSGVTPQVQPVAPAPPFLPRAVAPPVGDITISTIDSAPTLIDLGTAARVDSLILKDAPVREVLSFLARSAGLNVVYTGEAAGGEGGEGGEGAAAISEMVSLDLENESVQDAFNYVLMVSGLQANRRGRTIVVSPSLPLGARNLLARSYRLNQVDAGSAASFLATQGASVQLLEQTETEIIDPETQRVVRVELDPPAIRSLTADVEGTGGSLSLLLSGLAVSTDPRTNTLTMVGEPRQLEIATAFLSQLDVRVRQVAINVKVVDVNLLNQDNFNTSFSFGIADSFFGVDGGQATVNYGDFRPPSTDDLTTSATGRPVFDNPFAGSQTFLDFDNPVAVPGTTPGTVILDNQRGNLTGTPRGTGLFPREVISISDDPFATGVTARELAENNVITISSDGEFSIEQGTLGTASQAIPNLLQFPRRFLASLQAQVTSGNAKILTDPTLVVQEGQEATVRLVQEVITNVERTITTGDGLSQIDAQAEIGEAGLSLTVAIERIDDNGFITLSVSPRVAAIGEEEVLDLGFGQNVISLLNIREVSSGLIRMRDGQTLILAGIIQETDRTTVSKVPILGDIPLLGALFRSTNRDSQRQEIIVLVTPQILDDTARFGDWGYNYTPGQDAGQILQQQGIQVPRRR